MPAALAVRYSSGLLNSMNFSNKQAFNLIGSRQRTGKILTTEVDNQLRTILLYGIIKL
ncbi:MAG: hypothetical protein K2Z81_26240 [Cyanobacteria bacterium]|nr:hypothetical protein [Cyanobacteriota bacterium]